MEAISLLGWRPYEAIAITLSKDFFLSAKTAQADGELAPCTAESHMLSAKHPDLFELNGLRPHATRRRLHKKNSICSFSLS